MSARVRVAQVAELSGVGLEPAVAPDQVAVGTESDGLAWALGPDENEGVVAHDAATIAASHSARYRNATHVGSRDRVIGKG
jgi:hypothetical protein